MKRICEFRRFEFRGSKLEVRGWNGGQKVAPRRGQFLSLLLGVGGLSHTVRDLVLGAFEGVANHLMCSETTHSLPHGHSGATRCAVREIAPRAVIGSPPPLAGRPAQGPAYFISLAIACGYRKMNGFKRSFLTRSGAIDLILETSLLGAGVGPEVWQALCSLSVGGQCCWLFFSRLDKFPWYIALKN